MKLFLQRKSRLHGPGDMGAPRGLGGTQRGGGKDGVVVKREERVMGRENKGRKKKGRVEEGGAALKRKKARKGRKVTG